MDGGGQDAEVSVEEKDDEEGEGSYSGELDYCPDLLDDEKGGGADGQQASAASWGLPREGGREGGSEQGTASTYYSARHRAKRPSELSGVGEAGPARGIGRMIMDVTRRVVFVEAEWELLVRGGTGAGAAGAGAVTCTGTGQQVVLLARGTAGAPCPSCVAQEVVEQEGAVEVEVEVAVEVVVGVIIRGWRWKRTVWSARPTYLDASLKAGKWKESCDRAIINKSGGAPPGRVLGRRSYLPCTPSSKYPPTVQQVPKLLLSTRPLLVASQGLC